MSGPNSGGARGGARDGGRISARPLAAGALLAALALIIGLAAYYLPLVGGVISFVMPLPITLAYLRYGWRLGAMTTAVTALLALFVGGPLVGFFVAMGCVIGLALGYGISRRWPFGRTVLLAAVVAFVSTLLGLVVSMLVIGPQFLQQSLDLVREGTELMLESMRTAGVSPELVSQVQDTYSRLMASPWPFVGLSLVFASVMYSMVWYAAAAPALTRLGHEVPRPGQAPPVAQWHLPPALGLASIVAYLLAIYLGGGLDPASPLGAYLGIGLTLIGLGLMFQGLGLLAHLLVRYGASGPVRRPLLVLAGVGVFLIPPLAVLLFWMGMFDLALDFRGFARGRLAGGSDDQDTRQTKKVRR